LERKAAISNHFHRERNKEGKKGRNKEGKRADGK